MRRIALALSLVFTLPVQAPAESLISAPAATEIDDQAIGFFTPDDSQLYNRALQLVLASNLSNGSTPHVFVTTSNSEWTAEMFQHSGYQLSADEVSLVMRRSIEGGGDADAVIIFWDRIKSLPNPMANLILAFGREIYGGLRRLHASVTDTTVVLESHLFVYKQTLKFLRELPGLPGYELLLPQVKAELDHSLKPLKKKIREYQSAGRKLGLCGELLRSEEN